MKPAELQKNLTLVRKAYSKAADMPGGPERTALVVAAEPAFTATMIHLRDPSAPFELQQKEAIAALAKLLGNEDAPA